MLFKTYSFFVPFNWSFYILLDPKNKIYLFKLYSTSYYYNFSIPIEFTRLFFDYESNTIYFYNRRSTKDINHWLKELQIILTYFTSFLFFKVKFKGKGYYIYKNARNTIAPQFGYSHRIYIYSFFNIVKFLTKTKILIFGFSKNDILKSSNNIKTKRPINIFTGRGVRFSKQIVYKKTGKVSMYR